MKSPFPGMDPYLESRWSDVHATLVVVLQEALQPLLPEALRARTEELLEEAQDEIKGYRADIAVVDTGRPGTARSAVAVATMEPILVEKYVGVPRSRWVQIIDTSNGNRVVTVIEVLSPWNKGSGRLNKEYCKKVRDYRDAGISLVELDLLRYPPRGRLEITEADVPYDRLTPYMAVIQRGWKPTQWRIHPMPLRQQLPRIPIPLRQSDAEITLDLQPLIERVYAA